MAEKKYEVAIRRDFEIETFTIMAERMVLSPDGMSFYKGDQLVASVPQYVWVKEEVSDALE